MPELSTLTHSPSSTICKSPKTALLGRRATCDQVALYNCVFQPFLSQNTFFYKNVTKWHVVAEYRCCLIPTPLVCITNFIVLNVIVCIIANPGKNDDKILTKHITFLRVTGRFHLLWITSSTCKLTIFTFPPCCLQPNCLQPNQPNLFRVFWCFSCHQKTQNEFITVSVASQAILPSPLTLALTGVRVSFLCWAVPQLFFTL